MKIVKSMLLQCLLSLIPLFFRHALFVEWLATPSEVNFELEQIGGIPCNDLKSNELVHTGLYNLVAMPSEVVGVANVRGLTAVAGNLPCQHFVARYLDLAAKNVTDVKPTSVQFDEQAVLEKFLQRKFGLLLNFN